MKGLSKIVERAINSNPRKRKPLTRITKTFEPIKEEEKIIPKKYEDKKYEDRKIKPTKTENN